MNFSLRYFADGAVDIEVVDQHGIKCYLPLGYGDKHNQKAIRTLHYYRHHYKGTCKDWLPF